MSDAHDVSKMVGIYKKLFILLVAITALGIVLSALHMPWIVTLTIALGIIALKSKIVFDAFKGLLVGKNILIVVIGLTLTFFLALVILPLLNHSDYIKGTQDLSKEIQAEQAHAPSKGHGEEAIKEHKNGH